MLQEISLHKDLTIEGLLLYLGLVHGMTSHGIVKLLCADVVLRGRHLCIDVKQGETLHTDVLQEPSLY